MESTALQTARLTLRKISEREGMRMIERRNGDFVSGAMVQELWELTRDEWLAMQAPTSG